MTINEVFEKAIKETQSLGTYKGQFYSPDGVVAIIRDIQSKVVGNNVIGVVTGEQVLITRQMRDRLVEMIDDQIAEGLNKLSTNDVIDISSIEMSISGGSATLDNIDIDTDTMHSEITWHTDSTVTDWLDEFNIQYAD